MKDATPIATGLIGIIFGFLMGLALAYAIDDILPPEGALHRIIEDTQTWFDDLIPDRLRHFPPNPGRFPAPV